MKRATKTQAKSTRVTPPANPPAPLGSIQAGELLTLAELKRRLRWGEHAVRMARQAGLRLIPFGREKFALGADVLEFFRRLGDEQPRNRNGGQ